MEYTIMRFPLTVIEEDITQRTQRRKDRKGKKEEFLSHNALLSNYNAETVKSNVEG